MLLVVLQLFHVEQIYASLVINQLLLLSDVALRKDLLLIFLKECSKMVLIMVAMLY